MKITTIITAGGVGKRMGATIPKQFLELDKTPVLMHTIQAFYAVFPAGELLVTLPKDWWSFWEELCVKHGFMIKHQLVEGGKERFHSIQNALQHATGEIVLIHDGVRPLVSKGTMHRVVEESQKTGAAVPVMPMKESVRFGSLSESKSVDRNLYFSVQTPQGFQTPLIKEAYALPYDPKFTDDASVIEKAGFSVVGVEGNEENLKITSPFDLKVAQLLINKSMG